MRDKEYVWIDAKLAKQLKDVDDTYEQERLVLEEISKRKLDIKRDLEELDDNVLQFKALGLKYKNELTKVYQEQADIIEKLWENTGNAYSAMRSKLKQVRTLTEEMSSEVKALNKEIECINYYKIERAINFMEKYKNMSKREKRLIKMFIATEK